MLLLSDTQALSFCRYFVHRNDKILLVQSTGFIRISSSPIKSKTKQFILYSRRNAKFCICFHTIYEIALILEALSATRLNISPLNVTPAANEAE